MMLVRATFLKDSGEEYSIIYQHVTESESRIFKAIAILMDERDIPHSQLSKITIEVVK